MKYVDKNTQEKFENIRKEIGDVEFKQRLRMVFGKPVLDYAKSLVINLPCTCYANCSYCIDKGLRKHVIEVDEFLATCERVFLEFPGIQEVSITGGSLPSDAFNRLLERIHWHYPDARIIWNTNGIGIDETYHVEGISYINLHRNAINEERNKALFFASKPVPSLEQAKALFGDALCIRVTVGEDFNLDEYVKLGIPLYINRMLPGTPATETVFQYTLSKLKTVADSDVRGRNVYKNCQYQGVSVRVCMGDALAKHVPNRYPIKLNVVVIHRSGIVCGSWFEDDKVLTEKFV